MDKSSIKNDQNNLVKIIIPICNLEIFLLFFNELSTRYKLLKKYVSCSCSADTQTDLRAIEEILRYISEKFFKAISFNATLN